MYLQITTRCNMTCEHCLFSCTAEGEDMSEEVFRAALHLAEEYSHTLSIGGGEPTLHPKFWEFLGLSVLSNIEGNVWLATNGSKTKDALKLAALTGRGVLTVELSLDAYHDPISEDVIKAFKNLGTRYGNPIYIRDVTDRVLPMGRGKDIGMRNPMCPCEDLHITPNGDVYVCGCLTHKIGHVLDPDLDGKISAAWKKWEGECPNFGQEE